MRPGEKIPGSHYFYARCRYCREAMRSDDAKAARAGQAFCQDCDGHQPPPAHTALTPRMRHKLSKTES